MNRLLSRLLSNACNHRNESANYCMLCQREKKALAMELDKIISTFETQCDPLKTKYYTFEQLISFGRDHDANIVKGMPWSFNIHGVAVTHETDTKYIVGSVVVGPTDVLVFEPGCDMDVISFSDYCNLGLQEGGV